MLKMCAEMSEKIGKLEKDLARMVAEMGELRKENAKLERKGNEFVRQIARLNEELAKLRDEKQRQNLSAGLNNDNGTMGTEGNLQGNIATVFYIQSAESGILHSLETANLENLNEHSTTQFAQNNNNNVNGVEIKQESNEIFEESGSNIYGDQRQIAAQQIMQFNNDQNYYGENDQKSLVLEKDASENYGGEENGAAEMDAEGDEEMVDQNQQMAEMNGNLLTNHGNFGSSSSNFNSNQEARPKYLLCYWPGCTYQTENKYKRNMERHWRTHTGERPFRCADCDRSFAHPHALKNHQLIHTGERPYACEQCGQTFTRGFFLNRHREKEHPI